MKAKYLIIIGLFISMLSACDAQRVYEGKNDFPKAHWYRDSLAKFNFQIDDISQPYNIYFNIRNSISYPYYNLYVLYYLKDSTGKEVETTINRRGEFYLMNPKTGEPYGDGIGDLYDHQVPVLQNFTFKQKGKYELSFRQYMRLDTLREIYSVGVRVEKAEK